MKRYYFVIVSGLLISGLFNACTCKRQKPEAAVNIPANEKINIKVERFDKDIFSVNIDSVGASLPSLRSKYGELFDLFNYKIANLGDSKSPKYPEELKRFVTDYYMNQDYKEVVKVYPNLNDVEQGLSDAFTTYRSYFPKNRVPRFYAMVSGWNVSVATTDTIVAISLDMYLGRKCAFYEKLQLDHYKRYAMQRDYILTDVLRAWGGTTFEFKDSVNTLLANMLYQGKMMYFVKTMIPQASDSIVFGFTPAQLHWCETNQNHIWTYLVEHKLLFSTQMMIIQKLIGPAPFTSLFTNDSPGRATVWLGSRIVDAYMKNNKDVTLAQLMAENDYQKVLRKSNFKP
jgi:hypothetical protein